MQYNKVENESHWRSKTSICMAESWRLEIDIEKLNIESWKLKVETCLLR
jgi:hypothetical protein